MLGMMHLKRWAEPFDCAKNDVFELPEDASPMINNSWFFGGNGADGTSMIMRLGVRKTGLAEVFLIYCTPDGRFYGTQKQEYTVDTAPLHVTCITPGEHFHVLYDGKINDMKTGELVDCRLEFDYNATHPAFDAMQHSDFRGMAMAYARPKWNKQFFNDSDGETGMGSKAEKKLTQRHYEQIGTMTGVMLCDGKEQKFSIPATRDRAFGKRDWNHMDDHIWIVGVTEDGQGFNFSTVSYPKVKGIFCGYSDIGFDKTYSLIDYKIESGDFSDGIGPEVLLIKAKFSNGKWVTIKCTRKYDLLTPFDNGNYYFHEGVGDIEINGKKARGSLEYGWNKDKSRWNKY